VNAAGVESDEIAAMAGDDSFSIDASKGQYYLLDKSQGALFHHVLFQCPGPLGKGILVSPTVHGNLIVGPDANPGSTPAAVPPNFRENIRNFAGIRAQPSTGDFIVGPSESTPHLYNIAGIKSPGLSAAPAIAADAAAYLVKQLGAKKKADLAIFRRAPMFKNLPEDEKAALIKENPATAVSSAAARPSPRARSVDALHAPITPRTLDAIKRRCNAAWAAARADSAARCWRSSPRARHQAGGGPSRPERLLHPDRKDQ
jgi:glycerol-3-phosphate dehydrogenase